MRSTSDAEMAGCRPKEDSFAQGSVFTMRQDTFSSQNPQQSALRRWVDSFRRDPGPHVTLTSASDAVGPPERGRSRTRERSGIHSFDLHAANVGTANTLLSRELKGRHLQMIAIGGSIGTMPTCSSLHPLGLQDD
jgi:amino acid transporter